MDQVWQNTEALIGQSGTFPTLHHSFGATDVSPLASVVSSHKSHQGGTSCNSF